MYLPSVSTIGNFLTIAFLFAIRMTPIASVTVTTIGRPSGIAATARLDNIHKEEYILWNAASDKMIWYGSQWLDWNNNQYNTIKSIQYYTGPRLIIISQAIGDKRILKLISSGWNPFESLSMEQNLSLPVMLLQIVTVVEI